MDILDNATIVKNLSDPKSLGNVWSMAKGLIGTVEFTEQQWDITRKHPNTLFCLSDEDSFNNWCMLWDSFEKQWKEDLEYLNLDDLDRWLVNESKDIAELEFRLNKVKCRTGQLWNLEEASNLHTKILNITDRLAEIILNLRRNAYMCMYDLEDTISFAHHRAWWMVKKVCKWIEDVMEIQKRMQAIINGAKQILNPQLDTSTEQEQTVKQISILEDTEIKTVMQAVEGIDLMEYRDGFYYWTGENALLSYLCSQISRYKGYSKQYRENMGDLPNWIKFEGIFKARGRRKDEWVEVDGDKLANYKKQYIKYHKKFSPDGCKDIDEIVERYIKI